jgi:hypothetical protein
MEGYQLSGFTFGRGNLLCRVYDKTRELRSRGATWPEAIWKDRDPDRPVWRVEFQFRRGVIRELAVDGEHPSSVADALDVRQALWGYGTEWLTLRDPSGDSNRSRWPLAAEWERVRRVVIGSPASQMVRERMVDAERLKLIQGFAGFSTSLAAQGYGEHSEETLEGVGPDMERYLLSRGSSFERIAAHKRQRCLRVGGRRDERSSA